MPNSPLVLLKHINLLTHSIVENNVLSEIGFTNTANGQYLLIYVSATDVKPKLMVKKVGDYNGLTTLNFRNNLISYILYLLN